MKDEDERIIKMPVQAKTVKLKPMKDEDERIIKMPVQAKTVKKGISNMLAMEGRDKMKTRRLLNMASMRPSEDADRITVLTRCGLDPASKTGDLAAPAQPVLIDGSCASESVAAVLSAMSAALAGAESNVAAIGNTENGASSSKVGEE